VTGGVFYFRFAADDTHRTGFRADSGTLTVTCEPATARCTNHTVGAFSASAHRWLQIREQGGTVFFETSPNQSVWTVQHSVTTPAYAALGTIEIGAGHWGALAAAEHVALDHFNANLTPVGWCPAATFVDTFDGTVLGSQWRRDTNAACTVTLSGSALLIGVTDGLYFCGVSSIERRSLENSSVLVKLPSAPNTEGVRAGLYVQGDSIWIEYSFIAGQIGAYVEFSDGRTYSSGRATRTGDTWLRIRHHAGVLYFDARPDDMSAPWENLFSTPTADSYTAVLIGVAVNDYDPASSTGYYFAATFDQFNLP
jgi:hypothetical protein